MWLEIGGDSWEFAGVDGEIHVFRGPSVVGAIEFESRLRQMGAIADQNPGKRGAVLYAADKQFRWLVDRCLQLNGISASHCSWAQIERLLFGWIDDADQLHPAILVSIHDTGTTPDAADSEGKAPPTIEELIASIAPLNGGIKATIDLLQNVTPKQLAGILAAQNKNLAAGSTPKASDDREGMAKMKERMAERAKAFAEVDENGEPIYPVS